MSTKPPVLLVPALIVSSLLAITLQWNSSFLPRLLMLPPVALVPGSTLAFDVYYLCRIYVRRHVLLASATKALTTKPWPHTPLLEGNIERGWFASLTWIIWWINTAFGAHLINDTRSEKDSNAHEQDLAQTRALVIKKTIRIYCVLFQFIAGIVIQRQVSRLQKAEDNVACQVSHDWHCGRCRQAPNEESIPEQQKTGIHLLSRKKPNLLLATLLSTSTVACVLLGRHFWPKWWIILPILITIHHAYFLYRLAQAARQPVALAAWPSIPIFSGTIEILFIYLPLAPLFSLYACGPLILTMDHDLWPQVWANPLWTAVYALEMLLLGAIGFVLWCSLNIEWADKCAREGHNWQCSRDCGIATDSSDALRMSAAA
jgi:hypothetical protein